MQIPYETVAYSAERVATRSSETSFWLQIEVPLKLP